MTTTTKQKISISIHDMKNIIMEVENQIPVPFIHVKMRTLFSDVLKHTKDTKELNPMYKQIYKISGRNYRLVTNYEQRVKTNRIKEGKNPDDFVVESPKGKHHISKSMLMDNKTSTITYVMIEVFDEVKGLFEFEFDGNIIDKMIFERWISDSKSSNSKQGLDREIHPITPNMENILEISINGVVYELQH